MSENQTPTSDQMMFQYLGASVLLCWNDLPRKTQDLILDQANDAIGIVAVPRVRDQIASFLTRRTRPRHVMPACRPGKRRRSLTVSQSRSMGP